MSSGDLQAAARLYDSVRSVSEMSRNAVLDFEAAISKLLRINYALAVSSGTAALHLALKAYGIGPGDEVIVPSHTFVGTAAPVVHLGATPVFADVDPRNYCLDIDSAFRRIGPRTRAIVPVHLNGYPMDLGDLVKFCRSHDIVVVEDMAQALGAEIRGAPVGSLGHASCISFFDQKILTTGGEGGAVATKDPDVAEVVGRLRSHGEQPVSPNSELIWSTDVGYNYRLSGVQAAIGLSQADRLESEIDKRRQTASCLTALLSENPHVLCPSEPREGIHTFWRYALQINPSSRLCGAELAESLRRRGIPSRIRYPFPVHRQPAFRGYDPVADCPIADRLSEDLITLPTSARLRDEHIEYIAKTIQDLTC